MANPQNTAADGGAAVKSVVSGQNKSASSVFGNSKGAGSVSDDARLRKLGAAYVVNTARTKRNSPSKSTRTAGHGNGASINRNSFRSGIVDVVLKFKGRTAGNRCATRRCAKSVVSTDLDGAGIDCCGPCVCIVARKDEIIAVLFYDLPASSAHYSTEREGCRAASSPEVGSVSIKIKIVVKSNVG